MAPLTKDELIQRYIKLKIELGHQPSFRQFLDSTKTPRAALAKLFGSGAYSKLAVAAGDSPNYAVGKAPAKSEDEYLTVYGSAVRKLGHHPAMAEWAHAELSPTIDGYRHKFLKPWGQMPEVFREYAKNKPEWSDVVQLLPSLKKVSKTSDSPAITDTSETKDTFSQFVPPVFQNLERLSSEEGGSLEFEKKVNLAFQVMGFDVETFGQGTGRNPDGIACDLENYYAVMIDAKARKEGYSFGTNDREVREYLEKHQPRLKKKGIKKFYFVFVSSRFKNTSKSAADTIKREYNATVTFLTAGQLSRLIAARIEFPRRFDFQSFESELLFHGGELSDRALDEFIEEMCATVQAVL